MPTDTRSAPVASEVISEASNGSGNEQLAAAAPLSTVHPQTASAAPGSAGTETRSDYVRRIALRARLHGYAIAAVALIGVLIALAASNTEEVKVNWLIGGSHVSLVWLVLVAAIVGWLLGLLTSARFNWRTRGPRPRRRARS